MTLRAASTEGSPQVTREPDLVDRLVADSTEPFVCVIGRSRFHTGIGAVSYAACELLSRSYPVSIWPTDDPSTTESHVQLPNGRLVPVCRDLTQPTVFFYTDVLWNGAHDFNYQRVGASGLRIAHIAYDSDRFPSQWVEVLNRHFDIALFSSRHLEEVARDSGVRIAVGTLPIGLDLAIEPQRRPSATEGAVVRIGALAAFHDRKGHDLLLEGFARSFGDDPSVQLLIHSNLRIGNVFERLSQSVADLGLHNVTLSHEDLTKDETAQLLSSFDVLANCSRGEGYSIGLREAIALGKVLVASDIGAHQDLFGPPGVFRVPTYGNVPARYPEIDNLVVGRQADMRIDDVGAALQQAVAFVRNPECARTVGQRTARAAEFSFQALATDYAEAINPDVRQFHTHAPASNFTMLSPDVRAAARAVTGSYLSRVKGPTRTILQAHDGGFFSVFNAYLSHLTWGLRDDRTHLVLPDWDVARLVERVSPKKIVSFCYGKPSDGNLWLRFFEPLFGLSPDQMNSEEFLYSSARIERDIFNASREPLLTFINAYELYRHPDFARIRRQYNRVIRDHVTLRADLRSRIDEFCLKNFEDKVMIAAHVKHPSHMIEQPGGAMASTQIWIERAHAQLERRGFKVSDPGWGLFLATDQDRVINLFQDEFGDRVFFYEDVRRTTVEEDEAFDALSAEEKAREGHQVQHLVATNSDLWSTAMADEVIADMVTMSRCHTLLHVVSNVSTAAAFFNPDLEMDFTS